MTWTTSLIFSVLCLTGHILSIKVLGEKFPSSFVTPAFYTFAIIMLYGLFFYDKPKVDWQAALQIGMLAPLVIAGLTIGLTDFFFVKSLNLGAAASTAMPIMVGGAAVLVAIFSVILFKEPMPPAKILGIALAVTGIFLIHRG